MQRTPSTRSNADTKCISDVPGLAKHTFTSPFSNVRTRLSAPFIKRPLKTCCYRLHQTCLDASAWHVAPLRCSAVTTRIVVSACTRLHSLRHEEYGWLALRPF